MSRWLLATFALAAALVARADAPRSAAKADPAATKLLADARAARAMWGKDFPGFTADIEVNLDGKISKGRVAVDSTGKVRYHDLDKEAEAWAKATLGSIVGHRLDTGTPHETPCAFADDNTTHPMGRLIRVLNDELHSGYRIRDEQIFVVDRNVGGQKFTISVLENRKNKEGKYLSVSFAVDYWNPTTGELVRSDANFQSWTRLGAFDLPVTARVVTAERIAAKAEGAESAKKTPSAKSLTLSNHKLIEPAK
jgi:hypothetical protein